MKLPSRVQFTDENIKRAFEKLAESDTKDKQLHQWLIQALENIEKNAFSGIQIPKRLIPKSYLAKNIRNLWKYNLPDAWRLLYSIERDGIYVVSIVLEWLKHPEYERRFRY